MPGRARRGDHRNHGHFRRQSETEGRQKGDDRKHRHLPGNVDEAWPKVPFPRAKRRPAPIISSSIGGVARRNLLRPDKQQTPDRGDTVEKSAPPQSRGMPLHHAVNVSLINTRLPPGVCEGRSSPTGRGWYRSNTRSGRAPVWRPRSPPLSCSKLLI